jgi:hypothetical protein
MIAVFFRFPALVRAKFQGSALIWAVSQGAVAVGAMAS